MSEGEERRVSWSSSSYSSHTVARVCAGSSLVLLQQAPCHRARSSRFSHSPPRFSCPPHLCSLLASSRLWNSAERSERRDSPGGQAASNRFKTWCVFPPFFSRPIPPHRLATRSTSHQERLCSCSTTLRPEKGPLQPVTLAVASSIALFPSAVSLLHAALVANTTEDKVD